MVIVAGLAGHPLPAGVSVEVHGPWPRVEHRRWTRHTDCRWHTEVRADHTDGQAARVAR